MTKGQNCVLGRKAGLCPLICCALKTVFSGPSVRLSSAVPFLSLAPKARKNLYSGYYVIMPLDLCVFTLHTGEKNRT
jgi:hypothetical protein